MRRILFIFFSVLLSATVSSAQTLLNFSDTGDSTGFDPWGALATDGVFLYGMTQHGGDNFYGTIFKIKKNGSEYQKLFDFDYDSSGAYPFASLLVDSFYLYGLTTAGGQSDYGTIFRIKSDGSGFEVIHHFTGSAGANSHGSLIKEGVFLYGMAKYGGVHDAGVIFKIKPDGTAYQVFYDFGSTNEGMWPVADLVSDGTYLYGMTSSGGANYLGSVFKIKPDGTGYSRLHDFTSGDGPQGSLIIYNDSLYGMNYGDGASGRGTLFKIKTDGTGYNVLLDFTGVATGRYPRASLVKSGAYMYGTTNQGGVSDDGVIFKIKPNGTGFAKIYDFMGPNGLYPVASLIADGSYLYGMTLSGGSDNFGIVFRRGYCTPPSVFAGDTTICYSYGTIPLNLGNPPGGTYSGPAVTGNSFDPVVVGVGMYDLVYSYIEPVNGCVNFDTSVITVLPCLDIDENVIDEFLLYPNPTYDLVQISTGTSGTQTVTLTNISGVTLFSNEIYLTKGEVFTIDLTNESEGIYFLQVGSIVKKLIRA